MNQTIHIYQNRHVFLGDEHAGKYNSASKTIYLRTEFGAHAQAISNFFKRRLNIFPKAIVGAEPVESARPLIDFPDFIRELMDPALGDRSPVAIEWARGNLPKDDFVRRYGLEMPFGNEDEAAAVDPNFPPLIRVESPPLPPTSITLIPEITADALGGAIDTDIDDTPPLITEGTANFPQGTKDDDDDDFADSDPLREITVDPTHSESTATQSPSESVGAPAYIRTGDVIIREGVEVAGIYQDGKQLRMRPGFSLLRSEVEAFLSTHP